MNNGNIKQWFEDKGDYTHRVNYDLNQESVVFDLGGYLGWFVEQINSKYGSKIYCFEPIKNLADNIKNKYINNDNVFVFAQAISDENKKEIIYVDSDASSLYKKKGNAQEIECVTLDSVMKNLNIDMIDLLKINIEGGEYSLLEYMIRNNLLIKCRNIQVQFHRFIEHYDLRYNYIKYELEKTHHLTYCYPFIWENWELNK